MHNLLTDIAGTTVGHATDLALGSGITAILFEPRAVVAVAILGGAPRERQTAMLVGGMTVDAVDAIVLSGGSSFGLDAGGGVQAALREAGRGFALRGTACRSSHRARHRRGQRRRLAAHRQGPVVLGRALRARK
jgi:L-aminopeptidase/D-esterase-like protein